MILITTDAPITVQAGNSLKYQNTSVRGDRIGWFFGSEAEVSKALGPIYLPAVDDLIAVRAK